MALNTKSKRSHIKDVTRYALGVAGKVPAPMTSKHDIEALIRVLRPRLPGVELVRFGPRGDGGYLVPNDIAGIEACYSPGVSDISGFEKDCADAGMQVFMADRSVDGPALAHERFKFSRKYVGARTSEDFMTLDDWVNDTSPGSSGDLMLQIDIEGFEYETLLATSRELLGRFRIIVAEFHMLDQFWNRPFFSLASPAILKLLQTHTCVHMHPNNFLPPVVFQGLVIPPLMEFTFLRHDRFRSNSPATEFPHPLDADNTANPTLVLPAYWYEGASRSDG
jgi:hypothetical protein